MVIELFLEDPRWADLGLLVLAERGLEGVCTHLDLPAERVEVSLLGCDDARITSRNRDFRNKPNPTNVLSWPSQDLTSENAGATPDLPEPDVMGDLCLGDVAIAYETCVQEAKAAQKPVSDHVLHLLVHGFLHLLGYDHEIDADAALMERVESEILGKLGVSDPYTND